MYTFGEKTKANSMPKEESYSINHKAVAAVQLDRGVMVKINADGKVEPVTATTDVPYGILSIGCKAADETVTVQTQFIAIQNASATGALEAGDKVAASSYDTSNKVMKYKKAVSGDTIVGIALADAANNAAVVVGILRVFYPKA